MFTRGQTEDGGKNPVGGGDILLAGLLWRARLCPNRMFQKTSGEIRQARPAKRGKPGKNEDKGPSTGFEKKHVRLGAVMSFSYTLFVVEAGGPFRAPAAEGGGPIPPRTKRQCCLQVGDPSKGQQKKNPPNSPIRPLWKRAQARAAQGSGLHLQRGFGVAFPADETFCLGSSRGPGGFTTRAVGVPSLREGRNLCGSNPYGLVFNGPQSDCLGFGRPDLGSGRGRAGFRRRARQRLGVCFTGGGGGGQGRRFF